MSRISISFRVYKNAGKTKQNLRVCAKWSQEEWVSEYFQALYDLRLEDKLKFNPIP